MLRPSSERRESTTLLSRSPQKGHLTEKHLPSYKYILIIAEGTLSVQYFFLDNGGALVRIEEATISKEHTMKKTKKCWLAWGILYLTCTLWGFIPSPSGVLYGLLVLTSLGFFIPPGMLLHDAIGKGDRDTVKIIRNLSILSLSVTTVTIVLNFLSANSSDAVGTVLYWLLILVSTPMVCSQVWILSLFGWAMLMMVAIFELKKKE